MGQTSVERLHGRLDVLQTLLVAPPSWIQDGGAGNDVNQDLGYFFRSLLRGRCKMAALPLPVTILDDLISGSANEVIQDGGRKRKGRHFAPPPQWGSKKVPYTTTGEFPSQRPVTRSFDVFFDLCLNKWLGLVIWDAILLILTSL